LSFIISYLLEFIDEHTAKQSCMMYQVPVLNKQVPVPVPVLGMQVQVQVPVLS